MTSGVGSVSYLEFGRGRRRTMYQNDANFIRSQRKQARKVKRGRNYEALRLYFDAGQRLEQVRLKLASTNNPDSRKLLVKWLNQHDLSVEACTNYLKLYNYWELLQTYKPLELKSMTLAMALRTIEELRWSKLRERTKPSWLEVKTIREPFFILYH